MRVVIATDKFKGSLSAARVAEHLAAGLIAANSRVMVEALAIADGGEGTVDAALGAGFAPHRVTVSGPTGQPVDAVIAVRGREAVIEMAAASGLAVLPGGIPDALGATSRGTGQLIRAALDRGCTRIVLGVGGSACTDGGAGLLTGLGAGLLDDHGRELPPGGAALAQLAKVDLSGLDPRLHSSQIILASDVDNPLLGPTGAAAVFGPQKGADPEDARRLDTALTHYVTILEGEIGPAAVHAAAWAGSGAAGGVGYAAMAVLGALREPGIDVVQELTGLAARINGAGLVITGEGSLDEQSLSGKAPIGVARTASRAGVPVVAVCGRTTLDEHQLADAGFVRTYSLMQIQPDLAQCMSDAAALLERVGAAIGMDLDDLIART